MTDETISELELLMKNGLLPRSEGIDFEKILRLARLGIWAEKYGIAAVKEGLDNTNSDFCSHGDKPDRSWCRPFEEALAALPKTSTESDPNQKNV